jgi:hypothetical protein
VWSPDEWSPDEWSPQHWSPDEWSPQHWSPEYFGEQEAGDLPPAKHPSGGASGGSETMWTSSTKSIDAVRFQCPRRLLRRSAAGCPLGTMSG